MLDLLRALAARIAAEPVLVRSVAGGVIALVAIFGIDLDDDALDPVIDLVGLLAGLLLSVSARAKVTPV